MTRQSESYVCDIDISAEEWTELLRDETLLKNNYKDALIKFYNEPDHKSTCKALAEKYDVPDESLNRRITAFAQAVQKRLSRFEVIGESNEPTYWIIPMTGKYVGVNFEWTLRPELAKAIKECFPDEAKERIVLDFQGPFKFAGENSLFRCPLAKKAGVYIWVIRDELHEINYVGYIGETESFARRHREHFKSTLALDYSIIDIEAARQGVEVVLWPGMWRDKSDTATDKVLENYLTLNQKAIEHVMYRDVYFAATDVDTQLRRHIEGTIGWNLRNNHKDLNKFFPDEDRIRVSKNKYDIKLEVNLPTKIAGIDHEFEL